MNQEDLKTLKFLTKQALKLQYYPDDIEDNLGIKLKKKIPSFEIFDIIGCFQGWCYIFSFEDSEIIVCYSSDENENHNTTIFYDDHFSEFPYYDDTPCIGGENVGQGDILALYKILGKLKLEYSIKNIKKILKILCGKYYSNVDKADIQYYFTKTLEIIGVFDLE